MFSDPNTIVNQVAIDPGSSVADLGAGTGAYSFLLSKKVGPTGKVYACDVQKDLLTRLEGDARDQGITNIQTVLSNIETHQGTRLRDTSIDVAFVVNVLFQIEDRIGFVKEIYRILKPGGRVVLVDWAESFGNLGPHEDHVIKKPDAEKMFIDALFKITPQGVDAGAHHYGLVFRK